MSVAEILLEVTLTTFFSPSRDLFVVALYALVGFAQDCSSVLGIFFFLTGIEEERETIHSMN